MTPTPPFQAVIDAAEAYNDHYESIHVQVADMLPVARALREAVYEMRRHRDAVSYLTVLPGHLFRFSTAPACGEYRQGVCKMLIMVDGTRMWTPVDHPHRVFTFKADDMVIPLPAGERA